MICCLTIQYPQDLLKPSTSRRSGAFPLIPHRHLSAYPASNSRSLGTTSPVVTKYLLDLQPGLAVVLAATEDTDVTRYIHGPMGIHAQEDPAGAWSWMVQDGLGSVRGVVDNSVAVQGIVDYGLFGDPFGLQGNLGTEFGFTGEQTDGNSQVYLRARYYNPNIGVFTALDPFEGMASRPMSLNGYSWVEGNVPNLTDPTGLQCEGGIICTIDINPVQDTMPFYCQQNPNAFGCPGSGIIDGDISMQEALLLCLWLNNGACLGGGTDIGIGITGQSCPLDDPFCGIIIIPGVTIGTPLSGLTNEELSRLCRAGQGVFNEACEELLRRCNQRIPYAEDDINPCTARNTCTSTRTRQLRASKDAACSNYGCHIGMPCFELLNRIHQGFACRDARQQIITECYQNVADNSHSSESGELGNVLAAISTCLYLYWLKNVPGRNDCNPDLINWP